MPGQLAPRRSEPEGVELGRDGPDRCVIGLVVPITRERDSDLAGTSAASHGEARAVVVDARVVAPLASARWVGTRRKLENQAVSGIGR